MATFFLWKRHLPGEAARAGLAVRELGMNLDGSLTCTGGPHATPVLPFSYSFIQLSRSVVSDSLRPHELQHARPPCPSPTPAVRTPKYMFTHIIYINT